MKRADVLLEVHDTPSAPCGKLWIQSLWLVFRSEGKANCLRCKRLSDLIAAVREEPRAYQLQCARCGWATPWFDRRNGEIAMLGLDRFGRIDGAAGGVT